MASSVVLKIRQEPPVDGKFPIHLTLVEPGKADLTAEAKVEFSLSPQEHADLRWYLEDYLQQATATTPEHVDQIERMLHQRGIELYNKILEGSRDAQRLFDRVWDRIADLRVEIACGVTESAAIPWELMREPQSDSLLALRAQAFVRVQSNPNISFVDVPAADAGRIRLLYVVCRPSGIRDVQLRAIVNRLLQDLGADLNRFEITALRPPTYEQLQTELKRAKQAGRPYHIVHFDGHGVYADLSHTKLAEWAKALSSVVMGGAANGKHGYLLFERLDSAEKMRPVPGGELGKLLHDTGVPVLVLNACQSAMHDAVESKDAANVHDEVRAIGSLAQAVVDQGIPAVLGMRYSVYVVTAAQYVGRLYRELSQGRGFGEAASEGRKHLHDNPERWVGLKPRTLQDWFVPVVFEATHLPLLSSIDFQPDPSTGIQARDPVDVDQTLLKYVPDTGFIGRDETLLLLDRAFDNHSVVLLHAFAGQGKTSTSLEFARWYAMTGGLGPQPIVLWSSFESPRDLADVLNQLGQRAVPDWSSINDLNEKRRRVLQVLRQIPVLWIWDNVEPIAGFPEGHESAWTQQEQQDLANFLKQIQLDQSTKARFLLTSRRDEQKWLGQIPSRIAMPRMNREDAARLAVQFGTEKKLNPDEIAAWQPLIEYCDGNPLTLRVLAAQAAKMGLRGGAQIAAFVQAVRDGEQRIEDADASQGRDKSLGASLDYGFQHAFKQHELPIVALLHLFQGVVDIDVLHLMGQGEFGLAELTDWTKERLQSLLDRCSETGLVTRLGGTRYTIHPALPWFLRQLFDRYYAANADGATAALRAWIEAVGALGNYYHEQFNEGQQHVIQLLVLEEANLLHAKRMARRHGWWICVISTMQGLRNLYQYQGRLAEWSRLVAEIVSDFCSIDDRPILNREYAYSIVMDYRVDLARYHDHDLPRAAQLQQTLGEWDRQQAADVLALPDTTRLDNFQRNRMRTLAGSLQILGGILTQQGRADCVPAFEESRSICQRIGDRQAEAIVLHNLGNAYKNIAAIRDLDAAERAYQDSLSLLQSDAVGQLRCKYQIGTVHHERFKDSRSASAESAVLMAHFTAAESFYQEALKLFPPDADSGPIHNALGNLYSDIGRIEKAREHYEEDIKICEQGGDVYGAGQTRRNIAVMYLRAASNADVSENPRDLLNRARSYAIAAMKDFEHYEGRAADQEAKTQRSLDLIDEALRKLSE